MYFNTYLHLETGREQLGARIEEARQAGELKRLKSEQRKETRQPSTSTLNVRGKAGR